MTRDPNTDSRCERLRAVLCDRRVMALLLTLAVVAVLSTGMAAAQSDWTLDETVDLGSGGAVEDVEYSPNDEYIAVANANETLYILDADTKATVVELSNAFGGDVDRVSWHPDMDYVAAGESADGSAVRVFNVGSSDGSGWTHETSLTGSGTNTLSVQFSGDGQYLAFGDSDGNVYVHDVGGQWANEQTISNSNGNVHGLDFDPDAERLAFVESLQDGGTGAVYEVETWTQVGSLTEHSTQTHQLDWSAGGSHIAYGDGDGTVYVYDGSTYDLVETISIGTDDRVWDTSFAPDAQHLSIAVRDTNNGEQSARIYDTEDWSKAQEITADSSQHLSVAWSQDVTEFSIGTLSNNLHIYETGLTAIPIDADPQLEIDTRIWMEPGSETPYEVIHYPEYTNESQGPAVDVTGNASLTSDNSTVLSVDTGEHTLTASEDDYARVTLNASHDGLETTHNVTVSPMTAEYLEIIPGPYRFTATFNETGFQIILIAIMSGVVATRLSTAFGGIGAAQLVLTIGWFAGYVSLGIALVGLFAAMFIGFNLAANVDYTVRR